MADELTSEEATERLGAIYSGSLEGESLEKRLASIPKILEKYEGKWPGLIRAAEKKYGKPEEVESEATEGEETQVGSESEEKPAKKRGGYLGNLPSHTDRIIPSQSFTSFSISLLKGLLP